LAKRERVKESSPSWKKEEKKKGGMTPFGKEDSSLKGGRRREFTY